MNVNLYVMEDYENEPPSGPKKTNPNKPNSNPIKACPERSRMGQFPKGQNRLPKNLATPLFSHDLIIACLKWVFRLYYQD